MNWIDTLKARQAGARSGFLAADMPLEDQDPDAGGARVEDTDKPKTDAGGARVEDSDKPKTVRHTRAGDKPEADTTDEPTSSRRR